MFGASWKLGSVGGVPIRLHWSAFLGALFFGGFRFTPGAWLGYFIVILLHELGHAVVVKRTGQRVLGVEVHGLGGHCQWAGNPSPMGRAAIAWGGVWAQLGLFIVALPLSFFSSGAMGPHGADLFRALTVSNLMLAVLNLVPIKPLDGAEAWKIVPLLRERRARVAPRPKAEPPAVSSGSLPPELRDLFAKVAEDAREARTKRRN